MAKKLAQVVFVSKTQVESGPNKGEEQYNFESGTFKFSINANRAQAWTWEIRTKDILPRGLANKVINKLCEMGFQVVAGSVIEV